MEEGIDYNIIKQSAFLSLKFSNDEILQKISFEEAVCVCELSLKRLQKRLDKET